MENIGLNPQGRIKSQFLYDLYLTWCRHTGHNYPLASNQFGKEVNKAFPGVERKQFRSNMQEARETDRDRIYYYTGIDFTVDRVCGRYVYEGEEL